MRRDLCRRSLLRSLCRTATKTERGPSRLGIIALASRRAPVPSELLLIGRTTCGRGDSRWGRTAEAGGRRRSCFGSSASVRRSRRLPATGERTRARCGTTARASRALERGSALGLASSAAPLALLESLPSSFQTVPSFVTSSERPSTTLLKVGEAKEAKRNFPHFLPLRLSLSRQSQ